jgi:hypothetical protein
MPIAALHRILLAFEKGDADSPSRKIMDFLEIFGEFGDQKLQPKSTATEDFFSTGKLPFDSTIRMGNEYLDSLSPDLASWIWIQPNEKSRTQFLSISVVLSYSPQNFLIQWQVSRQIVRAACESMSPLYAVANAKDIDDEHSSALPDMSKLDKDAQLRFVAPLTFVSSSFISPQLAAVISNCFKVDQRLNLPNGILIDFSSLELIKDFDAIAECVQRHSDDKVTALLPQILVSTGE